MQHADRQRILSYYAKGAEWERQATDDGWLEYVRTVALIERWFPKGCSVLDLGGGPGRFTLELSERGYRPTLLDLSPALVDEAKQRAGPDTAIEGFVVGDAAAIPDQAKGPFDAVLCFGPLYHLTGWEEADVLLAEIARVLKPGGVLIAAFIPRMSGIARLMCWGAHNAEQVPPGTLTETLRSGRFQNPGEGFTEAYFAEPDEIRSWFGSSDFELERVESLRGVGVGYCSALRRMSTDNPALFAEALEVIDRTADRDEIIALGWHAVAIAHRKVPQQRWSETPAPTRRRS